MNKVIWWALLALVLLSSFIPVAYADVPETGPELNEPEDSGSLFNLKSVLTILAMVFVIVLLMIIYARIKK